MGPISPCDPNLSEMELQLEPVKIGNVPRSSQKMNPQFMGTPGEASSKCGDQKMELKSSYQTLGEQLSKCGTK